MTTVRQIIADGLREAGIIETGGEPSAEEHAEGLRRLQAILDSFFGNEMGEELTNLNYGTEGLVNTFAIQSDMSQTINDFYVPSNMRLILNVGNTETLYLNPNPRDGARLGIVDNAGNLSTNNVTLDGNGRQIEDADSVILATDGLAREWFYRADLGKWVRVTDIAADDESPLPRAFDDLLTTYLAFRLNPRYGATSSIELSTVVSSMFRKFRARYRQPTEIKSEEALLLLPSRRRYTFFTNDPEF